MKNRIHMRIFFPVLLVITLLPIAAWFVFSMTSDWYARHTSEKKIMELVNEIEAEASQIYDVPAQINDGETNEKRQDSRELLNRVKEHVRKESPEAKLLVLNSKKKQVYPGAGREEEDGPALYNACTERLLDGTLTAGQMEETELNGKRYMIYLYQVDSDQTIRAQYFIAYTEIPDMALLLSYTGTLIASIAAVCLLLAGTAVWLVAGSIAKPLEELCRQTALIGDGTYRPVDGHYTVRELEQLKESFNTMAERLKSADEKNMRFFQNVSHDLRTPLVSITGYAQGIQCGVMKDPQKAAGIILTESLRMTNLVESILTISKMDNRELKLNRVSVNLEDFLEEQIEILQGLSEKTELCLVKSEPSLSIEADPDLLIRIVQNVVSNCMRYAEGRVELSLSAADSQAVITVEDDGPGIPEEEMPHVFERFYQGSKGKFGIGLSVVWSGMEYMGGRVSVENKKAPDHGAVYHLYFDVR